MRIGNDGETAEKVSLNQFSGRLSVSSGYYAGVCCVFDVCPLTLKLN